MHKVNFGLAEKFLCKVLILECHLGHNEVSLIVSVCSIFNRCLIVFIMYSIHAVFPFIPHFISFVFPWCKGLYVPNFAFRAMYTTTWLLPSAMKCCLIQTRTISKYFCELLHSLNFSWTMKLWYRISTP